MSMRLNADEIEFIARKIVKTLVGSGKLEVDSEPRIVELLTHVITEELAVEDRLNEEVREVLLQHSAEIERSNMSYSDMFKMVEEEARQGEGHHPVKLSREKILRLSHLILHALNNDDGVEFFADVQQIRGEIHQLIEGEMRTDEAIDALVRKKIESQKRAIIEGSDEWEVLYRKYYEDEVSRHRKVMP